MQFYYLLTSDYPSPPNILYVIIAIQSHILLFNIGDQLKECVLVHVKSSIKRSLQLYLFEVVAKRFNSVISFQ